MYVHKVSKVVPILSQINLIYNLFLYPLIYVFGLGYLSRYSDGLRAGRPGFNSWQGQDLSFLHCVQTGSEAHPASYPVGTGSLFMGKKRPGREADHSPPSSAEV
jgi:hypothetical protein